MTGSETKGGGRTLQQVVLLGLALLTGATGCEPSCKNVCTRLLECDEVSTPRLAVEDCEAACLVQEQMYEDWEDTQLRSDFGDLKRCLSQSECGEIADGVCYQDDLYPW